MGKSLRILLLWRRKLGRGDRLTGVALLLLTLLWLPMSSPSTLEAEMTTEIYFQGVR